MQGRAGDRLHAGGGPAPGPDGRRAEHAGAGRQPGASAGRDQPPLWGRLPGFFLPRVAVPRSRLIFWPVPCFAMRRPSAVLGAGVRLRSASVTMLLPMGGSFLLGLV